MKNEVGSANIMPGDLSIHRSEIVMEGENHYWERENSSRARRDYREDNRDGEKREGSFLGDLIAETSPEYLSSIREARGDYGAKRVKAHEEVFGK